MEITFLGTGQAVPTKKRNHTAILLRHEDEMILFDCGEGTQRQFRIAGINPCKLTRVFITHWHGDHVLGLPGLLQTLALNKYSKTLHVYGPVGTKRFFSLLLRTFVFRQKVRVIIKEIRKGVVKEKGFFVEAFKLNHGCPCLGYSFKEKDKRKVDIRALRRFGIKPGPIVGTLQKGKNVRLGRRTIKAKDVTYLKKGKRISIILDTALCKNCYKFAKDADMLICEATYLHNLEDKAAAYKHLTAKQAAQIAKKARVKNLILTHISQRYEYENKKILLEAKKIFKNSVLAHDFMKITI